VTPEKINFMRVSEFRSEGYLQELNRRFLHPLGLALSTETDEHGIETLHGIWDYRHDPEGIAFVESRDLGPKADHVQALWDAREADRIKALGYMVQPERLEQE
jgi:hypothetical protein